MRYNGPIHPLQLICPGSDNFDDLVGTFPFRGELPCLRRLGSFGFSEHQISSFKDLAFDAGVIIFGHSVLICCHANGGSFSCLFNEIQACSKLVFILLGIEVLNLKRWKFNIQGNYGLCAVCKLEGGFSSGRTRSCSVGPQHIVQIIGPRRLCLRQTSL